MISVVWLKNHQAELRMVKFYMVHFVIYLLSRNVLQGNLMMLRRLVLIESTVV